VQQFEAPRAVVRFDAPDGAALVGLGGDQVHGADAHVVLGHDPVGCGLHLGWQAGQVRFFRAAAHGVGQFDPGRRYGNARQRLHEAAGAPYGGGERICRCPPLGQPCHRFPLAPLGLGLQGDRGSCRNHVSVCRRRRGHRVQCAGYRLSLIDGLPFNSFPFRPFPLRPFPFCLFPLCTFPLGSFLLGSFPLGSGMLNGQPCILHPESSHPARREPD
jgi:hypothetical protein